MSEKRKNSNSPLSTKSRFKLKTKRTANSEGKKSNVSFWRFFNFEVRFLFVNIKIF